MIYPSFKFSTPLFSIHFEQDSLSSQISAKSCCAHSAQNQFSESYSGCLAVWSKTFCYAQLSASKFAYFHYDVLLALDLKV